VEVGGHGGNEPINKAAVDQIPNVTQRASHHNGKLCSTATMLSQQLGNSRVRLSAKMQPHSRPHVLPDGFRQAHYFVLTLCLFEDEDAVKNFAR
jgi:hypothetical protein